MLVRASSYVASISRDQRAGSGIAAFLGICVVYAGIAACFYWLMQPTIVKNNGLAAYRPPPATVISAVSSVPAPSEALVPRAEPPQEFTESPVAAPKKEVVKREARTTPPRGRPVGRARPYQGWDSYASSPPSQS